MWEKEWGVHKWGGERSIWSATLAWCEIEELLSTDAPVGKVLGEVGYVRRLALRKARSAEGAQLAAEDAFCWPELGGAKMR